MPYISTDEVKEKRKALKEALPEYKLSVVRDNYSSIRIAVMQGPIEMTEREDGHQSVNHFCIQNTFKDKPEVAEVLQKIADVAINGQRELVNDSDYGSVPTFYVSLEIGKWDKPYKKVEKI